MNLPAPPWPAPPPADAAGAPPRPAPEQLRAIFLEVAASLGARVCRDALWAADLCNWIGPSMEPLQGTWRQVHRAYGPELYGGTGGIGLFLARLHAATGERVFRRTAIAATRHALARAEEIEPPSRIGAYSGWFGICHAALEVAAVLGEDSLRPAAASLLESALACEPDGQLDVLAGCAGAAATLLAIHADLAPGGRLVEAAARYADHLVARAVRTEAGWSWGDSVPAAASPAQRPPWVGNLTGFSHGAGGIGWSLLETWHATGEQRFREAAEGAFRYERHWFDPARGNWPDLRDPALSGSPPAAATSGPQFMTAWCHGAPGIGLSRLRAYEILGCESCRGEAEAAIATTLANLEGSQEMSQTNYSLCHGKGGNCDLLIYGALALGRPELLRRAEEVGLQALAMHEEQGLPWPCGTYGNVEVPGLMLGLSGIGHFYLRLADPERTPSVLILRPGAARRR
jgi:lantibiotic modifying enzyme